MGWKSTTSIVRFACLILGLALPVAPAAAAIAPGPADRAGRWDEAPQGEQQIYAGQSLGWYWVYEGIAQGQTFVALGSQVQALSLRVARLNDSQPTAPLEVEIRDRDLKEIYAHGTIQPHQAGWAFDWAQVRFNYRANLEKGKSYVLLIHSQKTSHDGPWLVNAIYRNIYLDGRHLGYRDTLFFSMAFTNGASVRVGPSRRRSFDAPINSGYSGGAPVPKPVTLLMPRIIPPVAARDPRGLVPIGQKVTQVSDRPGN